MCCVVLNIREVQTLFGGHTLLRGIAYNSSTKGYKSEITENCESEKWGSTHRHTTAKIDDVSKENTDDVSKENTDDVSKENNKKVSLTM